jgi:uncharacterized membrane protein YkvA (DUF1232 family)
MKWLLTMVRRIGTVLLNIILHPIMALVHIIQMFPQMWRTLKDPRVPWYGKLVFIAACVGYFFSPIDLLPEGAALAAGFIPPVMIVLVLLGVLEDFLLGIPLIGKLFLWWANRHIQKQLPRSDDASG